MYTVNLDIYENGDVEYYCNICLPPEFHKNEIRFIDMDIDVIRSKDGEWSVVDVDEFEDNAKELCYSLEVKDKVQKSLSNLLYRIEQKEFPFNGFFEEYINYLLAKEFL